MRTYYAIYIYFYTYDITWYAYQAWIWTALEADLGVICGSAPALKVIFRRYFNHSTDGSGSRSRKTWFRRPKNVSKDHDSEDNIDIVPLNGIKVSTCHHVTSQVRGDLRSDGSNSSTRNLTALPSVR